MDSTLHGLKERISDDALMIEATIDVRGDSSRFVPSWYRYQEASSVLNNIHEGSEARAQDEPQ